VFSRLLVLFIIVPLIELALLIELGGIVGVWPTIALVLGTGAVGAALARSQGARVLREIRAELAMGRMPAARMLDGLMILIGGILLLTPGVLSDLLGIALLFPPSRVAFKQILRIRLERMIRTGRASFTVVVR
jgi:UPF0716 protein FxsA